MTNQSNSTQPLPLKLDEEELWQAVLHRDRETSSGQVCLCGAVDSHLLQTIVPLSPSKTIAGHFLRVRRGGAAGRFPSLSPVPAGY